LFHAMLFIALGKEFCILRNKKYIRIRSNA
jgi:hypothetical protein